MSTLYLALFQIGSLFSDIEILMKIVGLLFIVSFVRQHVQHPILSLALILGLSAFLLFDFWKIFGGALFLYLLTIFGFTHILIDLSFMHGFKNPLLNIGGFLKGKPAGPRNPEIERYRQLQRERQAQQAQHGMSGRGMDPRMQMEHDVGEGMDPREMMRHQQELARQRGNDR